MPWGPDVWSNMILGVSVRMCSKLLKQIALSKVSGPHLIIWMKKISGAGKMARQSTACCIRMKTWVWVLSRPQHVHARAHTYCVWQWKYVTPALEGLGSMAEGETVDPRGLLAICSSQLVSSKLTEKSNYVKKNNQCHRLACIYTHTHMYKHRGDCLCTQTHTHIYTLCAGTKWKLPSFQSKESHGASSWGGWGVSADTPRSSNCHCFLSPQRFTLSWQIYDLPSLHNLKCECACVWVCMWCIGAGVSTYFLLFYFPGGLWLTTALLSLFEKFSGQAGKNKSTCQKKDQSCETPASVPQTVTSKKLEINLWPLRKPLNIGNGSSLTALLSWMEAPSHNGCVTLEKNI